jgi:hypothetical protein
MKITKKLFIGLILLTAMLIPWQTAWATPVYFNPNASPQDEVVLGGNYTLQENNVLDGNLWVFGGNADIRQGARVNGDIFLAGGNLTVSGDVNGDVTATGGNIRLYSTAVVRGDINTIGASLSRDLGSTVEGSIQDNQNRPFEFTPPSGVPVPQFSGWYRGLLDFIGFIFMAVVISGLAMLVAMFAPRHTGLVSATTINQPLVSGGLGCLTLVIAPVVLIILSITLILIPVSLLLAIVLGLMLLFGWIAIGLEIGKRLAELFKTEWPLPIAAGIGTLVLTIIVGGLGEVLPDFIGWVFPTLVLIVGLGAVLLTRFGTQKYPAYAPTAPAPLAPTPAPTGQEWPVYTPPTESGVGVYPAEEEPKPPENPYDAIIPPAPEDDRQE